MPMSPRVFLAVSTLVLVVLLASSFVTGGEGAKPAGKLLFDGKTLDGWKIARFGGEGEVEVKDGAIVLDRGNNMTGVTYDRQDFPRMNYEFTLEGKRIGGNDFFCTTTFPVAGSYCSFVVGGWGGTVVGLSSLDSMDASENDTTTLQDFAKDRWYRIKVRVTKERIESWIDDKRVVDANTKGKQIDIRIECELCRPFGIATYSTTGAVRNIRVRNLTEAEVAAAQKRD
jgi:hypothetical protein